MKTLPPIEIVETDFVKSEGRYLAADDSLTGRLYPRIPHLPGSQMTAEDHKAKEWEIRVCCHELRDSRDRLIVQEKLDGSCMAVAKIRGEVTPMARSGNRAGGSRYEQHRFFHKWVFQNLERFDSLLDDDEVCFGEWLMQAHGTRFHLPHEPFVLFDLKSRGRFMTCRMLQEKVAPFCFVLPRILHEGSPLAVGDALKFLKRSGHGAIDPPEGAIWRVERDGQVDFLAKYVRPDREIGCFLPRRLGQKPVWNLEPIKI